MFGKRKRKDIEKLGNAVVSRVSLCEMFLVSAWYRLGQVKVSFFLDQSVSKGKKNLMMHILLYIYLVCQMFEKICSLKCVFFFFLGKSIKFCFLPRSHIAMADYSQES